MGKINHLNKVDLENFVHADLNDEDARAIEDHLLSCSYCMNKARDIYNGIVFDSWTATSHGISYFLKKNSIEISNHIKGEITENVLISEEKDQSLTKEEIEKMLKQSITRKKSLSGEEISKLLEQHNQMSTSLPEKEIIKLLKRDTHKKK